MGTISGITFEKSNAIQTRHNDRDLPPSYLIEREKKDKIEVNRNHVEALKLKNQIIQEAIQTYTEKFNRKFIATSYEWSAVCNIKPDSKMEDLEKLAKHFKEKYGFQCYQIAIHRDEGHIDDEGNKVINHHAHMEFVTLNKENGRSMFRKPLITPKTLREIQTETAEILQMQRGEDTRETKRKHLKPKLYRQMKEEERQNLKKEKQEYKELKERAIKLIAEEKEKNHKLTQENVKTRQKLEELEAKKIDLELERKGLELINQTMGQQKEDIQKQVNKLQEDLKNERTQRAELTEKEVKRRLEEERQKMIKEKGHTQEDYRKLREIKGLFKGGFVTTMNDLENAIKYLQSRKEYYEKEYQKQYDKNYELFNENTALKKKNQKLEQENQELRMELSLQRIEKTHTEQQARMSQKSEPEHTTTPQPTTTEQTTTTRHIFTRKKKSNDIEW